MEEAAERCSDALLERDALWVTLSLVSTVTPVFIGFLICYFLEHRYFVALRMFCYFLTVYVGFAVFAWMIPHLGCPGVPMSEYPPSIKAAILIGYIIIPVGLTLCGCEFAWFCMKNKVFSNPKFSNDLGINWDQSFGFETVKSYYSCDECPLEIEIQQTGRCYGNAHDAMFSSKVDADQGDMPLYINTDKFQFDRVEDRSDQFPDFSDLKPWQAVQIKFSHELLPGDKFTLDQLNKWKEEHKKRFDKYTSDNFEELKKKNGGLPFNHNSFTESIQLKNLPTNVVIHDVCLKPWYITPVCWFIAFCGAFCVLWIPVALGVWRVKKLNITIRKCLFVTKEKYC